MMKSNKNKELKQSHFSEKDEILQQKEKLLEESKEKIIL